MSRVVRRILAGAALAAAVAVAACTIAYYTQDETFRIGSRERMQETLTRLIPPGTEAEDARRQLTARGFACAEPVPAEQARWPGPETSQGYEPLPAGTEVRICSRQNTVDAPQLMGRALWTVAVVHSGGTVALVIVRANFRAPL